MAVARFSFTLHAVHDSHIIRKLGMQPNLSATVRAALVAYFERPSHADIDVKLDTILEALRNVQVVKAGGGVPVQAGGSEPAMARRGLESMKARFRKGAA